MQTLFCNLITIINKSPDRLDRLRSQESDWKNNFAKCWTKFSSTSCETRNSQHFNKRRFLTFYRKISFSASEKWPALFVSLTKNKNEKQTGTSIIINFFEISHLRSHNNMNGFKLATKSKEKTALPEKQSHKNKSKTKRQTRATQSRQQTHPPRL